MIRFSVRIPLPGRRFLSHRPDFTACWRLALIWVLVFLLRFALSFRGLIRWRKIVEKLLRGHSQRRIILKALVERRIVNGFRMKLIIDPFFQDQSGECAPHRPAAARCQSVQRMHIMFDLRSVAGSAEVPGTYLSRIRLIEPAMVGLRMPRKRHS